GVGLEVGGDRASVALVPLHAQGEGLEAAQGEVRVVRAGDRADGVLQEGEALVDGRVAGDHGAADDVGVTADVLGGAVHDDVGAEVERALEGGREEGVVDREQHAASPAQRRDGGDVGELEHRVGGGLEPGEPGRGGDRGGEAGRV